MSVERVESGVLADAQQRAALAEQFDRFTIVHEGTLVREARELRGWSQGELALRFGVSSRTVRGWEQSARIPRSRRVPLAQELDLPQLTTTWRDVQQGLTWDDLKGRSRDLDVDVIAGHTDVGEVAIEVKQHLRENTRRAQASPSSQLELIRRELTRLTLQLDAVIDELRRVD